MSTRPRLTKLRLAHQSHKATKNGSVFPARIHERPSFLFGVDSSLPSSYPFVSWCLGVRFDNATSTGTASKLVSVSGVPAREDAVPSNLHYQSKLGTRGGD